MPNLRRYLLSSERTIFVVRRHGAALAVAAAKLALFWTVGLFALWVFNGVELLRTIALVFLLITVGWFAWMVGDWSLERFVVTDRRVLLISGILTRRVAIMPLIKVTDLTYEQSLFGRAFDYGAFVIESAGQRQALSRVDFLPQPNLRYQQVSALLFGNRVDIDPDDLPDMRHTEPVPVVRRRR